MYPKDADGLPDTTREKRFRSVELLFEPNAGPNTGRMEFMPHDANGTDSGTINSVLFGGNGPIDRPLQFSTGRFFHGLGLRVRVVFAHTVGGVEPNWILNSLRVWYQSLRGLDKNVPLP